MVKWLALRSLHIYLIGLQNRFYTSPPSVTRSGGGSQISWQNSMNCEEKTDLSPHFSCEEMSPRDRFFSIFLTIYHVETFLQLTICHMENFSTWQSVLCRNFLHMANFSPQAPPVVPVTNIRYGLEVRLLLHARPTEPAKRWHLRCKLWYIAICHCRVLSWCFQQKI